MSVPWGKWTSIIYRAGQDYYALEVVIVGSMIRDNNNWSLELYPVSKSRRHLRQHDDDGANGSGVEANTRLNIGFGGSELSAGAVVSDGLHCLPTPYGTSHSELNNCSFPDDLYSVFTKYILGQSTASRSKDRTTWSWLGSTIRLHLRVITALLPPHPVGMRWSIPLGDNPLLRRSSVPVLHFGVRLLSIDMTSLRLDRSALKNSLKTWYWLIVKIFPSRIANLYLLHEPLKDSPLQIELGESPTW